MDPLIWSGLLMLLGLTLVVVEVFIPSGGILGFLSLSALLASIVMAFYHRGAEVGFVFVAIAAVTVPVTLGLALHWLPSTPMGRRILLDGPTSDEVRPDSPLRRTLAQLVGKTGVAKTVMLPSGAIEIGDLTVDALSEGMPIEAGQRIVVVKVRGNHVVVRPYESESQPADPDDVLSQPIDSFGLNPFEDPLG